jgi:ABC-type polysaccharide/polyol phosphate export permease
LYYFIFSVIFKVRLGSEYEDTGFAFWLIAGLLPWMFVSEIISRAPTSVLEQSNLIKKIVFPSEIFPIVNLIVASTNHLIALSILVLALLVTGQGISLQIVLLVPYLILAGIWTLGISWILASLNIFLRDVGHLIGVLLNLWFFSTPIIYPFHLVPESLRTVYYLNPLFHIVEGYRTALLGRAEMDMAGFSYLLITGTAIIILGALTFRKLKPAFADVL